MTAKTDKVNARIEPHLKHEVEAILKKLGMSTTEAITVFFRQIAMNKGIPFDVRIPSKETQKAMRNVRNRKNLTKTSINELKKEFDID